MKYEIKGTNDIHPEDIFFLNRSIYFKINIVLPILIVIQSKPIRA